MPIRPLVQIPQDQSSYGHAHESENFDSEGRQQPADLPVFPLLENDFKPAVAGSVPQQHRSFSREEFAVFRCYPLTDLADQVFIGDSVDLNVVGLIEMFFRIEDFRGPAVVVGEKQKPFAGLVEPPHRGKPGKFLTPEAIINGLPPPFVGRGYDQRAGLVEHDINFSRRGDGPAVHFEAVPVQIHSGFRIPDYDSIKPDFSIPD